jgi:hypothetical protein
MRGTKSLVGAADAAHCARPRAWAARRRDCGRAAAGAVVIGSTGAVRVFAYSEPVDRRKSYNGLEGLVTQPDRSRPAARRPVPLPGQRPAPRESLAVRRNRLHLHEEVEPRSVRQIARWRRRASHDDERTGSVPRTKRALERCCAARSHVIAKRRVAARLGHYRPLGDAGERELLPAPMPSRPGADARQGDSFHAQREGIEAERIKDEKDR